MCILILFFDVTEWVSKKRNFNDELKDSSPNLIVVHPSTLDTIMCLNMHCSTHKCPLSSTVVITF
jgi:hypothetical protein